jgi:hypothetical protein
MRTYNLSGQEGNAYSLIGLARGWMLQFEWDTETIESVLDDMKSSDYNHLLEVFDKTFDDIVEYEFINDPRI